MPGSHSSGNILQSDVKFYAGRSRLLGLQQTQEEQRIRADMAWRGSQQSNGRRGGEQENLNKFSKWN